MNVFLLIYLTGFVFMSVMLLVALKEKKDETGSVGLTSGRFVKCFVFLLLSWISIPLIFIMSAMRHKNRHR